LCADAPSESESPLESKQSEESLSVNQGSPAVLSQVVSGLDLDAVEGNFIAHRMQKFMEGCRPGLVGAEGNTGMLLAAEHADNLLRVLDDAVQQLLHAQREFTGLKESNNPKMKLLNDWIWVLFEG